MPVRVNRIALVIIVCALLTSACSLRQTKVREIPAPTAVTTVIVPGKQALNWTVVSSAYSSAKVVLSYGLCPGQTLVGDPVVQESSSSVAITLWATQMTCMRGALSTITVPLPDALGHRPLTNPALSQ